MIAAALMSHREALGMPSMPPAPGLEWNKTTDAYARIGSATGKTRTFFDSQYPWAGMRRCNLADNGAVNAYYGAGGYVDDGSNGQVMVEIPKFYYRSEVTANGYRWYVSSLPKGGFRTHPAFVRDGIVRPRIYIGAYEACCYDVSASAYKLDDSAGIDFTATTGDKLASRSGAKPISGWHNTLTQTNARKIAHNRGTNWELQDFLTVSAVHLLMLIEYAHFDAQTAIGRGVVDITDDATTNMAVNTGQTASLGNASGSATGQTHYQTGQSSNSISYRGIENFWGNIWNWVDGINIKADHMPWIADHGFADDLFASPYVDSGLTLPAANGYVSDIARAGTIDYGFLPSAVAGSASTKLCDYHYQSTGNRAARLGGGWGLGSYGGPGCFYLGDSGASDYDRSIGARLLYVGGSS